jgi:hypothetical protein
VRGYVGRVEGGERHDVFMTERERCVGLQGHVQEVEIHSPLGPTRHRVYTRMCVRVERPHVCRAGDVCRCSVGQERKKGH